MSKNKKLPTGLQTTVKPGVISDIIGAANSDVEIKTFVRQHQAYWKEQRDHRTREGDFRLLQCEFRPDGQFLAPGPSVVVCLYGVPVDLWKNSGLSSEDVARIVEEHIADVCKEKGWNERWSLDVNWSSPRRELQIYSVINEKQRSEKAVNRTIKIGKQGH